MPPTEPRPASAADELPADLRPFFEAARQVPSRDPARAARTRAAYLAQVQALRPRRSPRGHRRAAWFPRLTRRLAWALAVLVLALAVSVPAAAHAAQDALPGSPFYPVKRWSEGVQLALARDPQRRATLLLTFAERRVREIRLLADQGQWEAARQALADLEALLAELSPQQVRAAEPLAERLDVELLTTAALAPTALEADLLNVVNGWAALHLQAQQDRATDLAFFVGPLEAIEGPTWRIGGREVHMGPETLIFGVPQPGDLVEVLGRARDDGSWQALEVRIAVRVVDVQSAQVEFIGVLEARQGSRWVVNGLEMEVAPKADIVGAPQVGQRVEVAATWDARHGAWILWHAEPVAQLYGVEVEFSGQLTRREGRVWWVAGLEVQVTPETRIVGSEPQIGDWVVVHAWRQADGTLLAEEVHVAGSGTGEEFKPTPTP